MRRAGKLEIELRRDHSVHIILCCDSAYEAAVLFQEIKEAADKGDVALSFGVEKVTEVKP